MSNKPRVGQWVTVKPGNLGAGERFQVVRVWKKDETWWAQGGYACQTYPVSKLIPYETRLEKKKEE